MTTVIDTNKGTVKVEQKPISKQEEMANFLLLNHPGVKVEYLSDGRILVDKDFNATEITAATAELNK